MLAELRNIEEGLRAIARTALTAGRRDMADDAAAASLIIRRLRRKVLDAQKEAAMLNGDGG